MLSCWQVKALRKSFKHMSQVKFAREIGVSCLSVNRWENNRVMISKMSEKLIKDYAKKKGRHIPRVMRKDYTLLKEEEKTRPFNLGYLV